MANPYRGEVALKLNGDVHVMRLTLSVLAELEQTLGEDSLLGLVERFETGAFRAHDLLALIHAGLKGGGSDLTLMDLAALEIDGGPVEAARAAARLLQNTFAVPEAEG